MSITAELRTEIENEASALTKRDLRRPGTSIAAFIDDYSGLLAQATTDQDALVAAGFDWSRMDKYQGYLEMLSLTHGERIGIIPESPELRARYDENLTQAEIERRQMGIVASYIVEQSEDKEARHNYRQIAKGSGTVDTLIDNISLVTLIRTFPQMASRIHPAGVLIDAAYLEGASTRAVELLRMKGLVVEHGTAHNALVDRQNRLLTLCLRARSDIRTYAAAAFFEDEEYYGSNYASPTSRSESVPETAAVPTTT